MVKLNVNGVDHSFDGDPSMPLLWYLRDVLGLTGTQFGCGMALCGACTVHKDGYDEQEALKVSGVHQTMLIDPFKPPAAFQPLGGVAVLADNSWADNRVLMHRGRK